MWYRVVVYIHIPTEMWFLLFAEFIQGVSQFSVKGDKLSKLRFAFRIYDMDNDGYISNGELFQVKLWLNVFILSFSPFVQSLGSTGSSQLSSPSVVCKLRLNMWFSFIIIIYFFSYTDKCQGNPPTYERLIAFDYHSLKKN